MHSDIQIPGYTLLEKIGEGGMAVVWKARQEKLDRIVAVKILRYRLHPGEDEYERFLYEARAAASLIHSNIVQVIDAGEQDGLAYYVMEYVPGPNVGDALARGEVYPEHDALNIALEVAEGLDYGWREHRVVHCDIKPDNLLLHRNGRTKVADLGLAQVLGQEAVDIEEGMTLGTPHYFSPEQALVDEGLDCRTDMYALGATLYHMVTGELPFAKLDPEEVAVQQVHGQIPDPIEVNPDLSTGICYLIERLMAKRPSDRYNDWGGVMDDIHAVRDGRMIPHPLPEEVASTVRRSPRRPSPNAIQRRRAARSGRAAGPVVVRDAASGSAGIRRGTGPVVARGSVSAAYHPPRPASPNSHIWPVVIGLGLLVLGLYAYTLLQAQGG